MLRRPVLVPPTEGKMAWTWDRYTDTTDVWHREQRKERQDVDPLKRFISIVDRMFYVAVAAFALSIVSLLLAGG
jgi:hypothetical protein